MEITGTSKILETLLLKLSLQERLSQDMVMPSLERLIQDSCVSSNLLKSILRTQTSLIQLRLITKLSQRSLLKLERLATHGQMLTLDQALFFNTMDLWSKITTLFCSVSQEPLVSLQLKCGAELLDFLSKDQTLSLQSISKLPPKQSEQIQSNFISTNG